MKIQFLALILVSLLNSQTNSFSLLRSHCKSYGSVDFTTLSNDKSISPPRSATARPRYRFKIFAEEGSETILFSSKTQVDREADRNIGILVLLTVPFAWGTFEPAVRYVYAIDPPVPALLFSFGYYAVASLSLGLAAVVSASLVPSSDKNRDETKKLDSLAIRGGFELGSYLFAGNWFQVLGLKTVEADRAAFLLQLTTILVPLVQAILDRNLQSIPRKTWGACIIAICGVYIITLDGKEGPLLDTIGGSLGGFTEGDFFIVAAAFSYTFHCIRLEIFAKKVSAVQLAASKAATETALTITSLASVLALSQIQTDGNSIVSAAQETYREISFFIQSNNLTLSNPAFVSAMAATLWTGLVTVAYTIYAQSFGQARVSPTDANLIYTSQPICTACFAWALLGETLGPAGFLGGFIIGIAVFMVVTDANVHE